MSDVPPTPPPAASPNTTESLDSSLLRVLMDSSADRIYFKDLQSRFVRNNATHARALGAASPEECVGKTDFDFFSREHAERAYADEQEIIRTGRPIIAKIERLTKLDGTKGWASSTKMPWRDAAGRIIGTFGLTRDITAAKDAEDKLNEERILLRTIIDHLPSRLYVKDTLSRYVLNNRAHLAVLGLASQEQSRGRTTIDFFPGERGQQALADDRQVFGGTPIINQEKSDFGPEGDVQWSLVTKVPLRDGSGQLVGLVGISHDITRRRRAEEELRRRSAEMEADLRMARQVQEAFLNRPYPIFPATAAASDSALRFAHRYLPAATLGGDFFDILQFSDTQCGVLICDVMGHGVRAGLLTALIRGIVEESGARAPGPAHVLHEVNQSLMPIVEQTGQPVFATAFFGVIDLTARTLTFANAGHPAPLIRTAGGAGVVRLAPPDPEPAAGLIHAFSYSTHRVPFGPGDLFLGYTDGVLEAADPGGQFFGEERLHQALTDSASTGGEALIDHLLQAVQAHCGRADYDDDVCLVAIHAARA
ncbi:MAG: SpoIIE family protein phosphatase [Verrucomicrobia bacterium]|nr:SpoIIE family protein phosphatase [Verrucomicrobiota bacterium]